MKPSTSPDYLNCRFGKEVDDQFSNCGEFIIHAVENAGGVPYQLNFGKSIREGHYLNTGSGIRQLFGITSGEFTEEVFQGMIQEIIPLSEDIPRDRIEAREKIEGGIIQKYNAEILIMTPGGEKKWIRDSAIPVRDEKNGSVTGFLGIFFDISEQKQTLIQLEKARERATESDRLKTAFLNNLSHEIRTPLNAIVGFSTLLGEPEHIMEERFEYMEIITHSSDHLLEIVDDIVEISKIEARIVRLIKKETNLNEMLRRVYDRFNPAAVEKNIILKYDIPMYEKDIIIVTDGYKLFQTLINLVGNAVKFTSAGNVQFGLSIADGKIQFYVSDTGIGIGNEHKPHIFKPFYQADSSNTQRYEGTGLGLSIAKAYVELLEGEIWFTSEPGKGSLFNFYLPDTRLLNG